VCIRFQQEKMKSCIHDLLETSRNYKQLLHVRPAFCLVARLCNTHCPHFPALADLCGVKQNNLEQVAQTITPSIRPLIEIFSAVNYQLNEVSIIHACGLFRLSNCYHSTLVGCWNTRRPSTPSTRSTIRLSTRSLLDWTTCSHPSR
jgi:hypothetical protein